MVDEQMDKYFPVKDSVLLPDSQLYSKEERKGDPEHYGKALNHFNSGHYIKYNLDHIHIAMDIRHVAKCIASIGDGDGIDSAILQDLDVIEIFAIKKDGTWEAYRQYVLKKYDIDMGLVPEGTERPSLSTIEATIQNWLNGEPLLFY